MLWNLQCNQGLIGYFKSNYGTFKHPSMLKLSSKTKKIEKKPKNCCIDSVTHLPTRCLVWYRSGTGTVVGPEIVDLGFYGSS